MREAIVCEKWPLKILDGAEGYYKDLKYQYLNRRSLALEWLFEGVEKGLSVVDYFGGVGALATIYVNKIEPSSLVLCDIEEDCIRQLKSAFPQADVRQLDSRDFMRESQHFDVAVVDHPYLTPTRWPDWQAEFDGVFAMKPSYVEMAWAVRRLPLLREVYSKALNREIQDPLDYAIAISIMLQNRYGYYITRAASTFTSLYVMVEPLGKKRWREPIYCHVTAESGGWRWVP